MQTHSGNIQNSIIYEEHDGLLNAKRTSLVSAATIYAVVNTSNSNVTLNPSPNFIGIVTVANPSSFGGNVTLNPSPNFIGIVTVANPSAFNGNVTLNPSPNFIGLVTVGNNPTLGAGANYIGLASVNIGGTLPALSAGTNYIGLASVQGNVNATQTGTWNVGVTGLLSLASGTEVRTRPVSNVTLNPSNAYIGLASVNIGGTLPALTAGSAYIGLASVNIGGTLPALTAGTAFIGLVSVQGNVNATQAGTWNVGVTSLISLASGTEIRTRPISNVTLNASDAFIGLATVVNANQPALTASSAYIGLASVNIGGTLPPLATGTNFIGLATVVPGSNVTLNASSAFIGLTTIVPTYLSTYTSLASIVSASGVATIAVPPSGKTFVIKDLFVSSLGKSEIAWWSVSGSATISLIPFTSLSTQGGYISNFGDAGLRGKAVDQSLTLSLNGTATISYMANVRFE